MDILEKIKKTKSEHQGGNFGFDSRKDYEDAVIEMSSYTWGDFGKQINFELLQQGKLFGLKFKDLTNPLINFPTPNKDVVLDAEAITELNKLNKSLNLSYLIFNLFSRNDEFNNPFDAIVPLDNSLIGPVLYFGIHGHKTLEVMREKLLCNPKKYFQEKFDAECSF